MLMAEFRHSPLISMYWMACVVSPDDDRVTFLYRFEPGTSPKSYGMNVARLAGLPESVVRRAREQAEEFEKAMAMAHG